MRNTFCSASSTISFAGRPSGRNASPVISHGRVYISSNDYYSGSNYATRMIDGKLVIHNPGCVRLENGTKVTQRAPPPNATPEQLAAEWKLPEKYNGYSSQVSALMGGLTGRFQLLQKELQ